MLVFYQNAKKWTRRASVSGISVELIVRLLDSFTVVSMQNKQDRRASTSRFLSLQLSLRPWHWWDISSGNQSTTHARVSRSMMDGLQKYFNHTRLLLHIQNNTTIQSDHINLLLRVQYNTQYSTVQNNHTILMNHSITHKRIQLHIPAFLDPSCACPRNPCDLNVLPHLSHQKKAEGSRKFLNSSFWLDPRRGGPATPDVNN